VRGDLATRLKVNGYRKSGRSFWRDADDHIRVVNVQASQWNAGDSGRIAVNLGVYFPDVAASVGRAMKGKFPKEYDCHVRRRLGTLAHENRDYWWPIELGTNLQALSIEIADTWDQFGSPWLEKASTFEGAKDELQHHPFMIAALSHARGDLAEARRIAWQLVETDPNKAPAVRE
jgi:hypothetical protein